MGFREFEQDEIDQTLDRERVVRLAFSGPGETYVVPVFYVWLGGALCGMTTPGRKTSLAQTNAHVGFQVDSVESTGPWEWTSVSGEGEWEVVTNAEEIGQIVGRVQRKLRDAPEWAPKQLQARFAEQGMVTWRVRPTRVSGRSHGPD